MKDALTTQSLSAIEHLLAHRPDRIRTLRLGSRPSTRIQKIEALAEELGVTLEYGSPHNTPTGDYALARIAPFVSMDWKSFLPLLVDHPSRLAVFLDHIQDPQNLGALCRSAEGLGAAGMVFPKDRASPVTDTVMAASAGTAGTLPLCQVANLNHALRQAKEAGFWVVGSTLAADSTPVDKMPDFERVALVLGAEGDGMSALTAELCDWKIHIPLRGHVQSLNVSAAGAILIHTLMERLHSKAQ